MRALSRHGNIPFYLLLTSLALMLCAFSGSPALARSDSKPLCPLAEKCPCSQFLVARGAAMNKAMAGMQNGSGDSMQMASMKMGEPASFVDQILQHSSAGTSAEPASAPHAMLMKSAGDWTLMFHASAFVNAIQQTGPRGGDKVFGTSWLMPMAQRSLGPDTLTVRGMFSLEPATITGRRFPELFQIGETAFEKPIVDGQHPHNFFMELAALYDVKLGENTLLSFYAAPVGDPALGPEAYPHRLSAGENPLATLGHHLQDSTHISDDVITIGVTYKIVCLEVSGFHGREPNENRWTISAGAIDSWSARLTLNPAPNWSGQYSIGRLHSPEQVSPAEDTLRMTTSVMYNRPFGDGSGNWATTLVWGRNEDIPGSEVLNSYLGESTIRFARRNYAWTRIENVDRTNLLLLGENPLPPGFQEHFLARVQAYTFGYDREFNFIPRVSSGVGGQFTLYGKPAFLDSTYGAHPAGFLLFVRLRPVPLEK
jgi:hypothetical protein